MKKLISSLLAVLIICMSVPVSALNIEPAEILTAQAHQYAAAGADYSDSAFKDAEKRIVAAAEMLDDTVNLRGLNIQKEDFSDFYFYVRDNNPQFFYMKNKISYRVDTVSQTVLEVYPEYLASGSELEDMKQKFDLEVSRALSVTDESMSEVEKALALHDYLVNSAGYDMTVYDPQAETSDLSYTAYGVLVNKIGVCQSYSFAYKLLLDIKCGVEVQYCASDDMNHIWNKVKIGGRYYNVDVTWDDPIDDRLGSVYHRYFLRSDSSFSEHSGYDTLTYPCTDKTYDSSVPWADVYSAMWWYDGEFYYVSSDKAISKYDFSAKTGKIIKSIPDTWWVFGSNRYYSNTYSSLSLINGRLYYNLTDRICSVLPDGTDFQEILTVDTSSGYIYGSAYKKDGLYYTYKKGPEEAEDIRLALLIPLEEPAAPDFDLYASAAVLPISVNEGEAYTVSATVRNLGSEAVPKGAQVDFYIDGKLLCGETLDRTIEAGRTASVPASAAASSSFGSHSLKIFVYHSKYKDETDRSNNIRKARFTID